VLALAACPLPALRPLEPDAGVDDAGGRDAGLDDAGVLDGGLVDAGLVDAGSDGGPLDAGGDDAGALDAGPMDAGDAGVAEAGVVDSGLPLGTIDYDFGLPGSSGFAHLSADSDWESFGITQTQPAAPFDVVVVGTSAGNLVLAGVGRGGGVSRGTTGLSTFCGAGDFAPRGVTPYGGAYAIAGQCSGGVNGFDVVGFDVDAGLSPLIPDDDGDGGVLFGQWRHFAATLSDVRGVASTGSTLWFVGRGGAFPATLRLLPSGLFDSDFEDKYYPSDHHVGSADAVVRVDDATAIATGWRRLESDNSDLNELAVWRLERDGYPMTHVASTGPFPAQGSSIAPLEGATGAVDHAVVGGSADGGQWYGLFRADLDRGYVDAGPRQFTRSVVATRRGFAALSNSTQLHWFTFAFVRDTEAGANGVTDLSGVLDLADRIVATDDAVYVLGQKGSLPAVTRVLQ
jgi:hypothetical protein